MSKKKLPEKLLKLSGYYSGDESWEEFANNLPVDKDAVSRISSKYGIEKTVAKAIEWHIGQEHAESWLYQNVPALDNHQPIDLLRNYENGDICVRVALRRMP